MSDRGTEKLREEVNPVFNTAKACLQVMAELGDTDAGVLMEKMDIQSGMSAPAGEGIDAGDEGICVPEAAARV